MTEKQKDPKGKRSQVKSKPVLGSPKEIFEFWDQESMRQATPIPFDADSPPGDADDPMEK